MQLIFPVAGHGRPRQRHIPDTWSAAAETVLARADWRQVSWRRGSKGRLSARFAAQRIRVADGPPQRIRDGGGQHMPGEAAWLIGEHRASGERKYYLSNLPANVSLRTLAAAIKARWVCEQAHQQMKEELGLDHFEGRSWTGLHRHALTTMLAYAFLQHQRLNVAAKRGKKTRRSATRTEPARRASRHHRAPAANEPEVVTRTMSALSTMDYTAAASTSPAKVVLGSIAIHLARRGGV